MHPDIPTPTRVCPSCKNTIIPLADNSCPTCAAMDRILNPAKESADPINHPAHYKQGAHEVIETTEQLSFCLGNVVKYVLRAEHKGRPKDDLLKAQYYLDREIKRLYPDAM
jgi:hypothetical protein